MKWSDFLQYAGGFELLTEAELTPLVNALIQVALADSERLFEFATESEREQFQDILALAGLAT